jgi:hypothetical protein
MTESNVPLVVHVGYPKTATTTFQQHVFPHHPEIEYLGKLIPSFRYADDRLYGLIDELLHRSTINFRGTTQLRTIIRHLCTQTDRKCVLLSSESFIHPSVIDIGTVADRLHEALGPCKVLITIREQISAILSFYWMHGRYGQYLTIGSKEETDCISYPISFSDWLRFQKSVADRNYLGTLHYDAVVRHYVGKFGANNVRVLLYEALKSDPDGYARDLGAFLGVDVPTLRGLMVGKHELRSKERREPWDKQHADVLAPAPERPRFLAALVKLFNPRSGKPPRASVEEEIAALRAAFRTGNANLAREQSLPLERFGYSV